MTQSKTKNYTQILKKSAKTTPCTSTDAPFVVYFYTNPRRLIFLLTFSGGVYDFYWFYKNCMAIEQASGNRGILPILRSYFGQFFCWRLFSRIHQDAEQYGYEYSKSARIASLLYVGKLLLTLLSPVIVWLVIKSLALTMPMDILLGLFTSGIITVITTMASIPALLITQRAIKFYSTHAVPSHAIEIIERELTFFEWVCIVLAWIVCVGSIVSLVLCLLFIL